MLNIKQAITHGGNFHADDVFSAAFLQILNPDIVINRVFKADNAVDTDGVITFDIGSGQYDHHQDNTPVRPNGVKYAAFGLLWRDFGMYAMPNEYTDQFDIEFIQPLDAADNGASITPMYSTIRAFNPNWDEIQDFDAAFSVAVDFAKMILTRQFARYKAAADAQQQLNERILCSHANNDPAVILPQFIPWQEDIFKNDLSDSFNYIIFPSTRGGYNVQCIPTTPDGRDQRKPFPSHWKVGAPALATFVHPGKFLVSAKTLDDAIALAAMAQQEV